MARSPCSESDELEVGWLSPYRRHPATLGKIIGEGMPLDAFGGRVDVIGISISKK